ncbi:S41 family peptidase [Caulobacter sp.]|uniref:S41 family peptidase n=1 Tax=Caulobacter sp. TaxID=78 RepID=UPI001B1050F8|nr:S41 family peptidase [Caulobacter sp.]MBO9546108.1 S41 family peptidase [Caulobacter sp.]
MRTLTLALATAALLGLSPTLAFAAEELTAKQAGQVVDTLVTDMNGYFDPARAAKVQAALKAQRGQLVKIHDRQALAEALSAITLKVSEDLHLRVSVATTSAASASISDADQALVDQRLAYGLMAARRLPGNIGYLKLRYFEQEAEGARMIDAAMGLLQHTDALIIDLRENTGGGGASDARLIGHLSKTPLVMAQLHWRKADGGEEIQQREADTPQAGPLYADKPIFVLTGTRTFSAAEGFAYDIQANKRGLLIGTRTRGGGNPSNRPAPALGFGLVVFVPNGQAIHPLTGKGWEGVGVQPDVETPLEGALTEAYRRALAAAKPLVSTPKSEKERADAIADPAAALAADQRL